MKLKRTLSILLLLLISGGAVRAATPTAPTPTNPSVPIMHHEDTWQPGSNNGAAPTINNNINNTITAPSTNNVVTPPSKAIPATNTTLPIPNAAITNTSSNKITPQADDDNDAFIKAVMKRNEILSQLQYEKQVLVLKQDIMQLKVNIDKLEAENTPPQAKTDPRFGGPSNDKNPNLILSKPQLFEIFIKNDKPQASIYYHGAVTTVNVGDKLDAYTVKDISKNTVTLAEGKNKAIVLNIMQSN